MESLRLRPVRVCSWPCLIRLSAALLLLIGLSGCVDGPPPQSGSGWPDVSLPEQSFSAGVAHTMSALPLSIGPDGARFSVSYGPASTLIDSASLTISGESWPFIGVRSLVTSGDRSDASLLFAHGGPSIGRVVLSITWGTRTLVFQWWI